MTHSILPPSSAGIWGKPGGCTGWVTMNQAYPETEQSPEAADGDASHWVASELLLSYVDNAKGVLTHQSFVGKQAPNGVVITEEMADAAWEYVSDVLAVAGNRGMMQALRVEQRVEIPGVHELCYGTPDCWMYDSKAHELFVWDYKFGFGVVEAFYNWQALNYAEGICDELGFKGTQDQTLKITIRIAQPRAFHREGTIREWKTTGGQLRACTNILHGNAAKALSGDAEFRTGDHCKHCPGRHACEPAIKAGVQLYEAAGVPVPLDITPEAIGLQLSIVRRAIRQLKALESGYTAQVESMVRRGDNVAGWVIEQTYGRQAWSVPTEEVIAMGTILDFDLIKPGVITPKQALKLGVDNAVITAYSNTPRTGTKLVADNGNKAKQVFSK